MRKRALRIAVVTAVALALVFAVGVLYQPSLDDDQPTVAVIFGYGMFLKDPSTAKVYVERILPHFKRCRQLRLIVVSGAVTRPTENPGLSEAQVLADEFRRQGVTLPILLEEQARTGRDNEHFSAELIERSGYNPSSLRVVVVSDLQNRPKCALLYSFWYFRKYNNVRHLGIPMLRETVRVRFASRGTR